jgi:N,N'-diacetylbacillosaminyl-diphospho-undecaprenol alpha-1,3-N-acetylgalactosaminyltransferase
MFTLDHNEKNELTKLVAANPVKVIQNIHFPVSARSFIVPIVDYLNQAGIRTELWVEDQPKYSDVIGQITVPKQLIYSDLVKNPIAVCSRIWHYYHSLKSARPTILHAHQTRAAIIPLVAGYLARVPIRIYQNHGLPYLGYKGAMRWFLIAIEIINIRLATHVLLVSKSNLEAARTDGLLNAHQGQVIASGSIAGIDLNEYEIEQFDEEHQRFAREKFGIDPNSFVLAYVGRPFKRKGFHRLLTSWQDSGLAAQGGVLLIAGCTQEDCQAAHGHNLEGIKALGYISNLQEFYAACDVTVLPSYHEGFSYAILEAAAAGKPSIGTAIPGISCGIKHNITGLLVPVDDDLALLQAIQNLASNVELRKQLGSAARQRVETEFSREIVLKEFVKFYTQILSAV